LTIDEIRDSWLQTQGIIANDIDEIFKEDSYGGDLSVQGAVEALAESNRQIVFNFGLMLIQLAKELKNDGPH